MLKIGSVIDGKYKILNVIGRGGMSIVYLAMNEKANKQWAIKELLQQDFPGVWFDKKEIQMMKKLKHPHLPSIVDVIDGSHSLLIVMDYIEGRTLADILEEHGAQSEPDVIRWAKQLCDVLSYLHTREPAVIYRDMKPSNVMLKPNGDVMLIDFGAAREIKKENFGDTIALGTQGYAAPEQYGRLEQSDERTDIYSLGVMMFQLLTGESPHRLCPVREFDPKLSSGLEAVIQKCTQRKKELRYQSCAELMYALEHYWEFDYGYRSLQKKKMKCFLINISMMLMLVIGATVFGGLYTHTRTSNYDACLLAAQISTEKEAEIQNYRDAITMHPKREDAYLLLLKNGFLDDNFFESKESECLREILIGYGKDGITFERSFQQNKEGYARFAYEAGIAYFYKFEEKSNKKNAKGYFEIAANSDYLESNQKERAKRLYVISEYYARIGLVDEAGDAFVTYRQYWDDLTALMSGNLVELDNERTALVMYKELIGQIISRTMEFKKDGVKKEEMEGMLEEIVRHRKTDFVTAGKNAWVKEELEELDLMIRQAVKRIHAVYVAEKE